MSVKKRGQHWAVTVYNPAKGRNQWVGTFPTRRDAKQAEAKAAQEMRRHKLESATVEGFAKTWLEEFPRPKQATNINHGYAIKPLVKDFGSRELSSIGRAEARTWALSHKPAVKSARALFSDAMKVDLCDHNPFAGLGFAQSKGRKDLEVLPRDEIDRIAGIARDKWGPPFHAFYMLAAYTGMRPGELVALRWSAIDLKELEVKVLEQFSTASRTFTKPKNGQPRTIVLPPPARDALLELPRGDGLLFQTIRGGVWDRAKIHYCWDPVRTTAGHPKMTFYELRHFCGSYLLNDLGLPAQDVAHQLGHTDGGVLVMKLYGHPSEKLARSRIKRAFVSNVEPLRPDASAFRQHEGGQGA